MSARAKPLRPLTPDEQALVVQWLPLSHKVARSYSKAILGAADADDVHAVAAEGLIFAAQTFDPSRGAKFVTHAQNMIAWAVIRHKKGSHQMMTAGQRHKAFIRGWEPPALVASEAIPDFAERYGDAEATGALDVVVDEDLQQRIATARQLLPPRSREVLGMYFDEELSMPAVAQRMGVTRQRVCQLVARALGQLRAMIDRRPIVADYEPPRCPVCKDDGGACANCQREERKPTKPRRRPPARRPRPIAASPQPPKNPAPRAPRQPRPPCRPTAPPPRRPKQTTAPLPALTRIVKVVVRPDPKAPSDPNFVHPGRGWGPVDTDGFAFHFLCNGTGKIRIKKESRSCFPCEGTGKRLCVPRDQTDERRSA